MTVWTAINTAYSAVFSAWFKLLAPLSPWLQILVTALPVTLLALLVFRYASNQAGIRSVKERIKAYLLELWLYKDDLGVMMRAQGQVMLYSLRYLGLALVPMAVMIVPLAPVLVQLESHFAFRGVQLDEPVIFSVTLDSAQSVSEAKVDLSLPNGIIAQTPVLRIEDARQLLWRLKVDTPGAYDIAITVDGVQFARRLLVGTSVGALWPRAYDAGSWQVLGSASEPALPADSAVVRTEIDYPRARGAVLGLSSASWLLLLFTLLFGFALRGFFGVTF